MEATLMFRPRRCMRTPNPLFKLLRGACSPEAGWAAWHRVRKRVQDGIAKAGTYRLVGPDGEMSRMEVEPVRSVEAGE